VLTTCQPNTVWDSRERLPAAAAQPAKVRQSCSATDLLFILVLDFLVDITTFFETHRYMIQVSKAVRELLLFGQIRKNVEGKVVANNVFRISSVRIFCLG
jgi:hypothetical protein